MLFRSGQDEFPDRRGRARLVSPEPHHAGLYAGQSSRQSRFKGKTDRGRCYPIRITWDSPVTRDYVLNYCRQQASAGDKNFKGFKHFDCHTFTPL